MKVFSKVKSLFHAIGATGLERICIYAVVTILLGWMLPIVPLAICLTSVSIVAEVSRAYITKGVINYSDIVCNGIGIMVGLFAIFLNQI